MGQAGEELGERFGVLAGYRVVEGGGGPSLPQKNQAIVGTFRVTA